MLKTVPDIFFSFFLFFFFFFFLKIYFASVDNRGASIDNRRTSDTDRHLTCVMCRSTSEVRQLSTEAIDIWGITYIYIYDTILYGFVTWDETRASARIRIKPGWPGFFFFRISENRGFDPIFLSGSKYPVQIRNPGQSIFNNKVNCIFR